MTTSANHYNDGTVRPTAGRIVASNTTVAAFPTTGNQLDDYAILTQTDGGNPTGLYRWTSGSAWSMLINWDFTGSGRITGTHTHDGAGAMSIARTNQDQYTVATINANVTSFTDNMSNSDLLRVVFINGTAADYTMDLSAIPILSEPSTNLSAAVNMYETTVIVALFEKVQGQVYCAQFETLTAGTAQGVAIPSILNSPAGVSSGNYVSSPHTLTLPTSRTIGDLVLFIVSTSVNSASRGSITGYTEIASSIQDARGVQLFGRIVDGTETSTVDLTGFPGNQNTVHIPILIGGAAGLPTGSAVATAVVDGGTSLSSPAVTGTGLVLRCIGGQYTMSGPSGVTEVTELQHTYDAGPLAASLWTDDDNSVEAVSMTQAFAGDAGAITVVITA